MSAPPTSNRPVEAWVASNLFELGIGPAVIARHRGSGRVKVGFFLLDVFCLGIKNAGYSVLDTQSEYDTFLAGFARDSPLTAQSPAFVRKLIGNSAAYAKRYGFDPHPDARAAARVFGDINPADCSETWEFGRDGKPFYMAGPRDTPRKIASIMKTLTLTAGVGNFDYIVPVAEEDLNLQ